MGELGRFGALLREWRERLPPAGPGPGSPVGARRTPGLRREEVAERSGISADYIKRLEQGRARPSLRVLQSMADALALAPAEYEHLCILTGHAIAQPGQVSRRISPATLQLLDRLDDVPVAVFDASWTLLRYNALGAVVCGDPAACTGRDRNMAWRYFTSTTNCTAETRQHAEEFEASLVADLRDAASRYPADHGLSALTSTLRTISTRFDQLWASGAAAKLERRRGVIEHAEVGSVRLDGNVLTVPQGELKLLVFTAEPGSPDADKLAMLRAGLANGAGR